LLARAASPSPSPSLTLGLALAQYFSRAYPESLHSLSGSSSDEVLVAAGLKRRSPETVVHVPDNLSAVDQLWPQLVKLVEPYGLKRRQERTDEEVGEVRKEADDLRDPAEVEVEGGKRRLQ
jgi:hypothetical protein